MKESRKAAGLIAILVLMTCAASLPAQEVDEAALAAASEAGLLPQFGLGLGLGTETIGGQTYQHINVKPDFGIGEFGIGLNIDLHFQLDLSPNAQEAVKIYGGDWIPDFEGNGKSFFDLYLPKISYLRYGKKGAPLFVKLGAIEDGTLGNGFIMGGYANTRFLPETKIAGLSFDLDGLLFNFPYLGFESFVGNLAQFDVVGGRLFARPLAWLSIPILQGLQTGFTYVTDLKPELYTTTDPAQTGSPVSVFGADFRLPIISSEIVSLAAFGDLVWENQTMGGMVGAGGKLFGIINLGAQLRLFGPGFVPTYFDSTYDLTRKARADYIATPQTGDGIAAWFALIGASFLDDQAMFNIVLDGPFKAAPAVPSSNLAEYPRLRGMVKVSEKLLGGIELSGVYEKFYLGKEGDFFGELVSPKNAFIQGRISYKTGGATIALVYDLAYDEVGANDGNDATPAFNVSSSLQTSLSLF
jgi:hypothetical protein